MYAIVTIEGVSIGAALPLKNGLLGILALEMLGIA